MCPKHTGGCFIYRRSIAKEVWGTDEPSRVQRIIGGGTESWDDFWEAAEKVKQHGYIAEGVIQPSANHADQQEVIKATLQRFLYRKYSIGIILFTRQHDSFHIKIRVIMGVKISYYKSGLYLK